MMQRRRILEQWNRFAAVVMPPDAGYSPMQRDEMRKAFYAGAGALFELLIDGVDLTGNAIEATPKDIEMMNDLHAEFQEFLAQERQKIQ